MNKGIFAHNTPETEDTSEWTLWKTDS